MPKKVLPPTPSTSTKYTNVNDAFQSLLDDNTSYDTLTEREKKWHNDLSNCHKALEQKDSTISNLKMLVMEWKRKATEYETALKDTQKRLEDRERFLLNKHKAEVEALTKVQVDQANENLEMLLHLERENRLLKSTLNHNEPSLLLQQQLPKSNSSTVQLCNEAEAANKLANEAIVSNKENSDDLIQRIHEMVNAMEDTLQGFQTIQQDLSPEQEEATNTTTTTATTINTTTTATTVTNTPALVSDVSSEESNDEEDYFYEDQEIELTKKKHSYSPSIPNFLFRNSNKKSVDSYQRKRIHSLNTSNWINRKPLRTSSLLS
ncbi:MAG: hypothetical protein EXX96DRAFT_562461 [Benjaminiella poitrasii]|nr:MAG: hypothetical protein EXX96DRAFT_562461 [Benjaminiella poitrasii]